MLDGGRIVGGGAILLVLAAGPIWLASARASTGGKLPQAAMRGPCVRPRATMLRQHPQILAEWREQAVRNGVRTHRASSGRMLHASLSAICLGCHESAEAFCNRCHASTGLALSCWACHHDSPKQSPRLLDELHSVSIGHGQSRSLADAGQ